jgi:hypothetical protein
LSLERNKNFPDMEFRAPEKVIKSRVVFANQLPELFFFFPS